MTASELVAGLREMAAQYRRGIDHWSKEIPAPLVTAQWESDLSTLTTAADALDRLSGGVVVPRETLESIRVRADRIERWEYDPVSTATRQELAAKILADLAALLAEGTT